MTWDGGVLEYTQVIPVTKIVWIRDLMRILWSETLYLGISYLFS